MTATVTSIRLSVNGEVREMTMGATVAALIETLGLDTRKLAVELNREIVPRSTYAAALLTEGDALEIVHFIGGG